MKIDELARAADVPVRTIREYQTLGLLAPPERRGRIGVYDDHEHLHRLRLIGRLQARGYSLAGIRDLLTSWASGQSLPAVLGVDLGPIALDETPVVLTATELTDRVRGLHGSALRQAEAAGLVSSRTDGRLVVRSPALLALVGDLVAAGLSLAAALELVREIQQRLAGLADVVAERFVTGLWVPAVDAGRLKGLVPMLRRDRLLLIQAAASMLTHELGRALPAASVAAPAGERLREAIEEVRVGAVNDAAGHAERRQ